MVPAGCDSPVWLVSTGRTWCFFAFPFSQFGILDEVRVNACAFMPP
jgi:hypothetical protein